MNLKQILSLLRARYKIALLVMLGTVAGAVAVTTQLPKQYIASTSLVIDVRNRDPVAAMLMPGSIGTQLDIIKSDRVAQKVVAMLELDKNPTVREQWQKATDGKGQIAAWLGGLLLENLTVKPGGDSNVISIEYKAADPAFAASVANAFAQAYIDATIELKVEPARQYARWFAQQGKALRENLEKAQARLSAYQQKKGIVSKDERLDNETAKLAALTSQLTVIQEQTADARSKQNTSDAIGALPEELGNSVIAGLRTSIAQKEASLREAAVNLGTNHPRYRRMESELEELKRNLKAETQHVRGSFTASRAVGRDKERGLRAAIEAQKRKVLELGGERDQLAVLQRDVDAAQQAYDAVTRRYNQTSLESQVTQANVSVLTPAVAPATPSFPKPLPKMVMLGLLLGAILGMGAAFGLEMLDRRIRSVDDLAEMLQLPVLSVVQRARRPRKTALPRERAPLALK
jgi:succinoglycan biosynthesis transport protein ExoP